MTNLSIDQFDEAAEVVRSRSPRQPQVAIILGSGLSGMADAVEGPVVIPFSEIPHFPISTVVGHTGRLLLGTIHDCSVLVMQGRVHFYEGYSMAEITVPVRAMQRLGIRTLIVTNAAGAVNPEFQAGDVMLITDHLNFLGMMGWNPLMGPNYDELGPRFPDMSQAYDRQLAELARQAASDAQVDLREGVYAGLSGPSFESPADMRFLRVVGADAVGMSTVHEVTVARHGGMRVLGFSGISNKANLDGSTVTTHEEVIEAGNAIAPKMARVIAGVLQRLLA
ncbi:MAG TPA: purine-nucleoside phosphorylase [Anaerolineales bacterium]|nr:purine-nucleoside phosphorylase [Anaerolineales bacterium]